MRIVSYGGDGLPRALAKAISIDGDNKLTFQITDDRLASVIRDLPQDPYELVLVPIPASARVLKENEMLSPRSAEENFGKTPSSEIREEDYLGKARRLVFEYVTPRFDKSDPEVKFTVGDVYVVWFCKTLQNWKALVSTSLPDQTYYEVTYDGDKRQTYITVYKQFDNVCIPDLPQRKRWLGSIPAGEDRFA